MDAADLDAAALKAAELIVDNTKSPNTVFAHQIFEEVLPLLQWADYLYSSERTGNCDDFIDGFRSSLVETIFCVSAGLTRVSLFSMRGQIDICLSWLYFKDHPVEYRKVAKSSDGFMLKSAVIKYLDEYIPKFRNRFRVLSEHITRHEIEPYRLLSAHVHSQNHQTLPAIGAFEDLLADESTSNELLLIQKEVTEYLSDILFSCYAPKWLGMSPSLVQTLKSRLPADKASEVLG